MSRTGCPRSKLIAGWHPTLQRNEPKRLSRYGKKCVSLQSEMSNDDNTLETLKRLVCEGAGVAAHTPGDFYTIMAFVEGRTHEGIGLTTVKRLWQYGGLSSKPRQATLDVLARSIGYRSYDDFATHYGRGGESSNIVLGGGIKVSDLFLGERLMLRWNPGREIVVEYLGNQTFRIVKSVASKFPVSMPAPASFPASAPQIHPLQQIETQRLTKWTIMINPSTKEML